MFVRQPHGLPLAPAGGHSHINSLGVKGGWPPFTYAASSRPKRRWKVQLFYAPLTHLLIMVQSRDHGQQKNDWVLYAWLIQRAGGELSLEELSRLLSHWKKRDSRTRRIAQVMFMHQDKGFEKVEERYDKRKFVSIWAFTGHLPDIHKRTLQHWNERLSPKGDKP